MTARRGLWLSLGAIAVFLLAGRALAGVYAERQWYASLGALDVWSLQTSSAILLRTIAFIIAGAAGFANFWIVRHSVVSLVLPRQLANIEIGEEVPSWMLLTLTIVLACVFGIAFALPASGWQSFELARHGIAFNESDPYMNADVGFYVYSLPFERSAQAWMAVVVTAICMIVVVLYALTPSLKWQAGRLHVSTYVRRHIAVLAGVAIALLAWSFRLDAYTPLTHGSGADGLLTSADHQFGMPISIILAYAAIGSAFVVAWAGWTGQSRVALAVITVLLLLTPTMKYGLPVIARWAAAPVSSDVRERVYERDRIGYTRRAFDVERVGPPLAGELPRSEHEASMISVWDPMVLTTALERAVRGRRVVGSPSLAATPAGPVFVLVEEIAPARDDPGSGGWAIVRCLASVTDERGEFTRVDAQGRYPLEDQRVSPVVVYEGAVGAQVIIDTMSTIAAPSLASFASRLAEAWSQQNFRLLGAPPHGARMMRRRDVRERVRAVAPFFLQSSRIIPVVHGDSLVWTLELYSATAEYPLARQFPIADTKASFAHHAATALVSARSGAVALLVDAEPDPITATWARLLPQTLARRDSIADSFLVLLPPDVDGAEVQGRAFAAVGKRQEPAGGRRLPELDGSDTLVRAHTPTFVWLPGPGVSAWVAPVIAADNKLHGVLLATGGRARGLRWIPAADTSTSWGALIDRLQHAESPRDNDRSSAQRVAGKVRMVPLADGRTIAVQPFYGWPTDGAPFVSHVATVVGDSVRSAPSIAAALGAPAKAGPQPTTSDAREERIRMLYAEMRAALENGDWRRFGAAFDALGAMLHPRR